MEQLRGDAGEKMPAATGTEKRDGFAGKQRQVGQGVAWIREAMAAKDPFGGFRVRIRIQHQVSLGLGLFLIGKGLVQQVVENGPGGAGAGAKLGQKSSSRAGTILQIDKAHAPGQTLETFPLRRQAVDLQIKQHLQTVLGLAEEAVGLFQQAVLLIGEATSALEREQGRQCAPQPQGRQVPTVGQLQKLNGVFNVADATAPGLHIEVLAAGGFGTGLNPALERLDLVDLGKGQVFAINERLNCLQKFPPQPGIPRHRADLDQGLALPGAAHGIVVGHGRQEIAGDRTAAPIGPKAQIHTVPGTGIAWRGQQAHHFR